ncbi:MAG: ABC transporter permease [Candidatus Acidiferrum sp.]
MLMLWQDIRYGLRTLTKSPGFAAVVVLTLALGIGANTAIFSVVSAVLLQPLPFPQPDRLVAVLHVNLQSGEIGKAQSYPDFVDLRAQSKSLEAAAAYDDASATLTGMGDPVHLNTGIFSADMFNVLRKPPMLGREFTEAEDKPGTHVAMLSYHLWKTRFGGDPKVTEKQIVLDGKPYIVAGVMPADFQFPLDEQPVDLWTTIAVEGAESQAERGAHFLRVIARLRSGVTLAAANAETTQIGARLEKQYRDTNGHWGMSLQPEMDELVGNVRPALLMVLGAVGFLLLIACANAANLLLARAAGRQREMAIRASLGAGKSRILGQLLTESVMLSLAGGALGLLLAVWGTAALVSLPSLGIPRVASAGVDWKALAFTLAVSVFTGILFGLAPALHASRFNLFGSLKEGGRTATNGTGRSRMRSLLVVSQVSLAVVLLTGASLLVESMFHLLHQSPGFDPKGVLAFSLDLPDARYGKPEQSADFFKELLGRIRTVPGVQSASAAMPLPLTDNSLRTSFEIEGQPMAKSDLPRTQIRAVGLDYFHTMRIPLIAGREFTARDDRQAPHVIIINQTLARRFFPNQSALGKHMKPGMSGGKSDSMCEIVGVVGDVKHRNLWQSPDPESYVPYDQDPIGAMDLVVRTAGDPMALLPALRARVLSMDAQLPIYKTKRMEDYVAASVAQRRFTSLLCAIFAGAGLLLAIVGLFGVMSYSVVQRTHEIGVRVAVGAEKPDILRLILKEGMAITIVGLGVGLAGTLALSSILKSQLFGVTATDPLTFLGVALALAVVALVACYLPARRATRVDPLVALRYE